MGEDGQYKAELIWFDDAVYRGETAFIKDKKMRHGLGVMFYHNGRVYEGFWTKDKRSGKGYERFSNGDLYIGDYVKGRPQGKGKRVWAETQEVYEGEWYQGMRHGIGNWTQKHLNAKVIMGPNGFLK